MRIKTKMRKRTEIEKYVRHSCLTGADRYLVPPCSGSARNGRHTPPAPTTTMVGEEALPHYTFGDKSEYEIRIASSIEDRRQAWALVYEKYLEKGYAQANPAKLWYGLRDALPETTTFLVTRHGQAVATLTLVQGSPLGVPADELYGDELEALRQQGRRICEITSLVSDETNRRRCIQVLRHMFKLAYLTATRLDDATDFVITVNPHHTAYYEKKMLFRRVGDVRSYDKVGGAPAALLRLDLVTAESLYLETFGPEVLRFFVNPETDGGVLRSLQSQRKALPAADVRTWFEEKRSLLSEATPTIRDYVWSRYAPKPSNR